ncbi:FHA domain-containing protein [Rhodobium gokarnense]|uniref:FHA domain-containing protein n=1 Tax=Rhodobium gokarnense TaxID=364296 RepID=A0ABT3H840_9HYPH|nr:FHA domain-containing protein [Rhodobium gokarnense]MCW2306558.1 hypothetical protein [Rhodobium gokarnense]
MARDDRPKQNKTTILYGDSVSSTRKVTPDIVDPGAGIDPRPRPAGAGDFVDPQQVPGGAGQAPRSGTPTQIHSGEGLMPLPKQEMNAQVLLEHLAMVAGLKVDTPALMATLKSALGISVEPGALIERLAKMAGINLVLQEEPVNENPRPVTGWLVVVKGPGKGFSQPITIGRNQIGRAPDQPVPLNYGDHGISREGHFSITYDPRSGRFLCTPGERQVNLCYIDNEPLVETVTLKGITDIEVSDSVLRFVPLCNDDFKWVDA